MTAKPKVLAYVKVASQPVQVFECGMKRAISQLLLQLVLRVFSPDGAAFEVVYAVHVLVRWHEVVHDDEVYLAPVWELNPVQAVVL